MKIEHIAVWVTDIEKVRKFYQKYFAMTSTNKYTNNEKRFQSYFLSFPSGARLELMQNPHTRVNDLQPKLQFTGIAHFAIALGSKYKVDELTKQLEKGGYVVADQTRTTGDGYYESVILDPENNRVELTV